MQPTIQLQHVSKRYRIGQSLPSLRSTLAGLIQRGRVDDAQGQFHWALRDVGFELQPGESLGIIGHNGAGKTTILKILANVTKPTLGSVRVNGRLSALIELGAGFHPDLSGRDNIYLNGAILGMAKADIRARFDQIVEFASIGKYLDTPIKRYSSGMYARLGFAIAAHVEPQVLLVDEVLAVGDYAFQMKCYARMDELRLAGTSLIFVSHNFEAVRRVCDRGLVLYQGRDIFQGSAAEAVIAYSEAIRQAAREGKRDVPREDGLAQRVMTFDAEVERVCLLDAEGQPCSTLPSGATAVVAMDVKFNTCVPSPIFAYAIRTPDGKLIYNTTTRWMNIQTPNFKAGERCRVEFTMCLPLLDGEYQLGVDITASDLSHFHDRLENALGFWINHSSQAQGIVNLETRVKIRDLVPAAETA